MSGECKSRGQAQLAFILLVSTLVPLFAVIWYDRLRAQEMQHRHGLMASSVQTIERQLRLALSDPNFLLKSLIAPHNKEVWEMFEEAKRNAHKQPRQSWVYHFGRPGEFTPWALPVEVLSYDGQPWLGGKSSLSFPHLRMCPGGTCPIETTATFRLEAQPFGNYSVDITSILEVRFKTRNIRATGIVPKKDSLIEVPFNWVDFALRINKPHVECDANLEIHIVRLRPMWVVCR